MKKKIISLESKELPPPSDQEMVNGVRVEYSIIKKRKAKLLWDLQNKHLNILDRGSILHEIDDITATLDYTGFLLDFFYGVDPESTD